MPMTADDLKVRLRLDFKPADLGDSDGDFTTRLTMVVDDALARPSTTDAQQEAGARYLLLAAQLRQLGRQVETFRAEGELTVVQGLDTRMAQLRREQAEQLTLSGLNTSARPVRGSVSLSVESTF